MVGVPGKYKGCNTCRARRVKCDNTRPFCKKCTDYGRECAGYERETVFIVGTPEEKGRCASHPPRNLQSSKRGQSDDESHQAEKLNLIATEPWQPAWNEMVSLTSRAGTHWIRIVAHQTNLQSAIQNSKASLQENKVTLSLLGSRPLDVTPTFGQEDFNLRSSCLINLPPSSGGQSSSSNTEGLCLFLYEQNSSATYSNERHWKDPAALGDAIREPGPAAYQDFPAHHFFARVYRPSAIWAALLNRQPTFLCSPEWTIVPWEHHPRTPLDDLLDIVVLLPSIYSRADRIKPLEPSMARQLKAKDLLSNCINIETQFDIWYSVIEQNANESSPGGHLYWVADAAGAAQLPFAEYLNFSSPLMCLVHIYYWTVLIGFHQCIYALLEVIFESEGESSSSSGASDLPPGFDPRKYQPAENRMLAANVCRSLDFALGTAGQPDLLAAPLWIVTDFFNIIRGYGEGEMEYIWCTNFKGRLEARSREMSAWLQEKRWTEISRFG
ncbi:hypothetical protein F5X99DRAFT_414878 [Biscogniauxia marginata]|nr:hypothetical protein F5X99DRAFT_414878 [Biscogniauxia marginata]